MEEWKECTLSNLGTIVGGATPSTKDSSNYENGSIAWITPKDLSTHTERFISHGERNITEKGLKSCSAQLMPQNSILFTSRAPIGYIAIAKNEVCTNQGFKSIVPNKDTDFMFLYYLLKYNKDNIENLGSGTTFKEVSGSTMKSVPVKVPPLPTQQKIAAILSSLDDKIELNNKINTNLEQQAGALFKNWFVDKYEKEGTIGDYCAVKSGFAFKSAWWQEEGTKVIRIEDIEQGCLNLETCAHIANDKIEIAKDFIVQGGDLVIAMTGATIGKFSMIPKTQEPILVNQRVGKFFLGNNPIEKVPFIYCTLKQEEIITEFINRGQGSAQPNISTGDILTIPCWIPSKNEIDNFNKTIQPMFETIISNQEENRKLSVLRDSLLPKLMNGEIFDIK